MEVGDIQRHRTFKSHDVVDAEKSLASHEGLQTEAHRVGRLDLAADLQYSVLDLMHRPILLEPAWVNGDLANSEETGESAHLLRPSLETWFGESALGSMEAENRRLPLQEQISEFGEMRADQFVIPHPVGQRQLKRSLTSAIARGELVKGVE
jgi:hypothetical protein